MELQQMRYVVAIAETGSFTRAAQRCNVVQSALSHQVSKLEHELGVRLFERNSRRLMVTSAGEAFLTEARHILAAAERARSVVAAAAGEIRGTLTIGTVPTFTAINTLNVVREFRARHPQAEVSVRTDKSELLIDQVRQGRLDVALVGLTFDYPIPASVRQSELDADELMLVTEPGHALTREPTVSLADLTDETFVDFPEGSQGRAESDHAFERSGVSRRVRYEIDHSELLVRFVQAGLAVGMLPEQYARAVEGVVPVAISDPPTRVQRVVWNTLPSPAARAFLDLVWT